MLITVCSYWILSKSAFFSYFYFSTGNVKCFFLFKVIKAKMRISFMKCYFNEQRLHSAASLAARLYTVWWDQCRLAVCHKLNWSSTEHMIALPLKGNLYAERPDAEIMTYFRLAVTAIWQMNGWAVMNNEVTCPLKIKGRCWGHQLQNSCYWMIVQCKCGLDRPLRVFVINQSLLLLNSTISHSILSARLPCEKPPCDVSPYLNYSQITDTPPPHTHLCYLLKRQKIILQLRR